VFKDGTDAWYDYDNNLPNDILAQKDNKIWNISLSFDVAKDVVFTADYLKSNIDRVYSKNYEPIEFDGDDGSFKILKYSAQFLLDIISHTDYEKFNIAIYGKKK
jgi:hypothetical protein